MEKHHEGDVDEATKNEHEGVLSLPPGSKTDVSHEDLVLALH